MNSAARRDSFPYVRTRRMREQRWLLDATIRQLGVDWDQGRSRYLAQACGVDAEGDFARVRERVRTFVAIEPAFASAARRREALAEAARRVEHQVEPELKLVGGWTAREVVHHLADIEAPATFASAASSPLRGTVRYPEAA